MQYFDICDSPLGEIRLACDGDNLTALFFAEQTYGDAYLPADAVQKSTPVLEEVKAWLAEYFLGNAPRKLPAMHFIGTDFQKRVWEALLEIPYGETVSYGQLESEWVASRHKPLAALWGETPSPFSCPVTGLWGRTAVSPATPVEWRKRNFS